MLQITDTVYEWATVFSSRKGSGPDQNSKGKVYNFGSGANNPDEHINHLLDSMARDSENKISENLKLIRTQNIKVLQAQKVYDPKENRYSVKWLSLPNPNAQKLQDPENSTLTPPIPTNPRPTPTTFTGLSEKEKKTFRVSNGLEKSLPQLHTATKDLY